MSPNEQFGINIWPEGGSVRVAVALLMSCSRVQVVVGSMRA